VPDFATVSPGIPFWAYLSLSVTVTSRYVMKYVY